MKLSIIAELTQKQIGIIGKNKGRSNKVINSRLEGTEVISEEVENTQSIEDFVAQVYQSLIAEDMSEILAEEEIKEMKETIRSTKIAKKEQVIANFSHKKE